MSNSKPKKDDARTYFLKFIAGALGGGTDSFFTMPFDTTKTQMQINRNMGSSFFGCVRTIFVTDGVRGFYKGYVPFGIMAAGKASMRWGTMGLFTGLVDSCGYDRNAHKTFWTFTCGLGAGCCEALAWTAPNERLKVLRQVSAGTGIRLMPYSEIYQIHGFRGLWVGATPTMGRSASNAAIRFSIATHIQGGFRLAIGTPSEKPLPFWASFLAGGIGGAISVCMNNPFDVLKSKIQAGYQGGMIKCSKEIFAERGLMGFTAGLTARTQQIFLSQAIQFAVVDQFNAYFGLKSTV